MQNRQPAGLSRWWHWSAWFCARKGRIRRWTIHWLRSRAVWFKRSTSNALHLFTASSSLNVLFSLAFRGTQTAAYVFIYEHLRLYEMPWDSVWTWILCALGLDLGYYWAHRATHGIICIRMFQRLFKACRACRSESVLVATSGKILTILTACFTDCYFYWKGASQLWRVQSIDGVTSRNVARMDHHGIESIYSELHVLASCLRHGSSSGYPWLFSYHRAYSLRTLSSICSTSSGYTRKSSTIWDRSSGYSTLRRIIECTTVFLQFTSLFKKVVFTTFYKRICKILHRQELRRCPDHLGQNVRYVWSGTKRRSNRLRADRSSRFV